MKISYIIDVKFQHIETNGWSGKSKSFCANTFAVQDSAPDEKNLNGVPVLAMSLVDGTYKELAIERIDRVIIDVVM